MQSLYTRYVPCDTTKYRFTIFCKMHFKCLQFIIPGACWTVATSQNSGWFNRLWSGSGGPDVDNVILPRSLNDDSTV